MGKQKTDKNILEYFCIVIASFLGVGYLPLFGGTVGSLCGVVIFLSIRDDVFFAFFTLGVVLLSFITSHYAEFIFHEKDSKKIIIDDCAGMLVSFLFIPKRALFVVAGFILFRFFDFFKVYPSNKIERISGGLGVTGDDMVAGVYTNVILQVLKFAVKSVS